MFCTTAGGDLCEDVLDDDIFSVVVVSVDKVACLSGCSIDETPVITILGGEYKAFHLLIRYDFMINQLLADS